MEARVAQLTPKINAALAISGNKIAADGEKWMKDNAPWNDITGNARSGLRGRYKSDGLKHHVVFYHTMPYGIWLEVRFEARNAIIMPAVERHALLWTSLVNGMLKGL